jgi:hypothetical protein
MIREPEAYQFVNLDIRQVYLYRKIKDQNIKDNKKNKKNYESIKWNSSQKIVYISVFMCFKIII